MPKGYGIVLVCSARALNWNARSSRARQATWGSWALGTWVICGDRVGRLRAAVGQCAAASDFDGGGGREPGPGCVEVRWGDDFTVDIIDAGTLREHIGGWEALTPEQQESWCVLKVYHRGRYTI